MAWRRSPRSLCLLWSGGVFGSLKWLIVWFLVSWCLQNLSCSVQSVTCVVARATEDTFRFQDEPMCSAYSRCVSKVGSNIIPPRVMYLYAHAHAYHYMYTICMYIIKFSNVYVFISYAMLSCLFHMFTSSPSPLPTGIMARFDTATGSNLWPDAPDGAWNRRFSSRVEN